MAFEEKLNSWRAGLWLQWKGMGKAKYIPLIVNYSVWIIGSIMYKRINTVYYLDEFIEKLALFIPLFSVWWEILLLQQYVEGEGRELLWINRRRLIADIVVYFILYLLIHYPIFQYILEEKSANLDTVPIMLSQCLLCMGLAFFLSLLFSSISMAFVPIVAYLLYEDSRIQELLPFLYPNGVRYPMWYLLIGIVFIGLGVWYNAKIQR